MDKIKELLRSKTFFGILYGMGILIVVLAIFQAGVFVGYHKAGFAYRFGENYYGTFGRERGGIGAMGLRGMMGRDFASSHGVVGKIIKVSLPTLIIEGQDKVEKVVAISDDTDIHLFRADVQPEELKVGQNVVVIGAPNDKLEIDAKLIRIMPDATVAPVAKPAK